MLTAHIYRADPDVSEGARGGYFLGWGGATTLPIVIGWGGWDGGVRGGGSLDQSYQCAWKVMAENGGIVMRGRVLIKLRGGILFFKMF